MDAAVLITMQEALNDILLKIMCNHNTGKYFETHLFNLQGRPVKYIIINNIITIIIQSTKHNQSNPI